MSNLPRNQSIATANNAKTRENSFRRSEQRIQTFHKEQRNAPTYPNAKSQLRELANWLEFNPIKGYFWIAEYYEWSFEVSSQQR